MLASICVVLLFLAQSGTAQEQDSWPVNVPQVTIEGRNAGICPSAAVTEQAINSTKEEIHSILRDTVVPVLDARACRTPCGGPGWRRIAHLDMSDPDQQCPSNWRLITTPVRACGRTSSACDSAVFPSNGASYSRVCGRINAFQKGTHDAFNFIRAFRDAIPAWKVFTLTASPSLMGLLVHDSTSGHLLLHSMKLVLLIGQIGYVLAQTPTQTGHTKYRPSSETIISVTLAILDLAAHLLRYTKMILCGMVRGVVLEAPAANSATLLGSARHCHNPLPMTLS